MTEEHLRWALTWAVRKARATTGENMCDEAVVARAMRALEFERAGEAMPDENEDEAGSTVHEDTDAFLAHLDKLVEEGDMEELKLRAERLQAAAEAAYREYMEAAYLDAEPLTDEEKGELRRKEDEAVEYFRKRVRQERRLRQSLKQMRRGEHGEWPDDHEEAEER